MEQKLLLLRLKNHQTFPRYLQKTENNKFSIFLVYRPTISNSIKKWGRNFLLYFMLFVIWFNQPFSAYINQNQMYESTFSTCWTVIYTANLHSYSFTVNIAIFYQQMEILTVFWNIIVLSIFQVCSELQSATWLEIDVDLIRCRTDKAWTFSLMPVLLCYWNRGIGNFLIHFKIGLFDG